VLAWWEVFQWICMQISSDTNNSEILIKSLNISQSYRENIISWTVEHNVEHFAISVSLYLERLHRYGILKMCSFWHAPYSFIYLFILNYLFIYLFIYLFTCLCVYLFTCFVCLFILTCVCLLIYLFQHTHISIWSCSSHELTCRQI